MTDDVLPELLKLVCDEFEKSYADNGIVKQVQKKLEDKSATYADAYEYAYEVGCMLSDALTKHVTNELLPNGTMYYNIAQRLLQKTLGTNYKLVSELAVGVQKVLNRKAGLTLAALKPDIDQDKVDGLIERLSKGDFENDKFVMGSPIANFTQSVVDDTIAKNVEFHSSAGLQPKIVRRYAGNGCKWCANLAGTYNYPVKQEIYRRHDNCRCIVEYFPEDGRGVQNAHTKGWRNESKVEREQHRQTNADICDNRGNDILEYKKIVDVLGRKNAPVSLAKFQELKYNDVEKYENLVDRAYIQNNFNNGIWLDKVNPEKQARHIQSTVEEGKSYFFDDVDIESLYNKYKMTGTIRKLRNGSKGSDEKIDLFEDKPIGVDIFTGKPVNAMTIKYSKTGAHLIPTYYERKN